jgi:hypothetical protein
MSKYRDLAKKALEENRKGMINENLLYEEGITERMHPELENRVREGRHSLAECVVMPEGDVITTEMKLIRERFKEVVMRCREAFDMDTVDDYVIMKEQLPLVMGAMAMEEEYKEKLEKLAVEMIMEEFDIPEGTVEFDAKLVTSGINREGTIDTPKESLDEEFNDNDEKVVANEYVKKRRVLNAMTQGAAKSVNHMFHMVHEQLTDMNPRLPGNYKKMMSAADYMYFIIPDMDLGVNAGKCDCDYQQNEEGASKPVIKAEAMVFPVLVHELYKGVMEVLSAHGLPTQENIAEYVVGKADFVKAEPDDMRFGTPMWRRFCDAIPADDFNLKHHVYADVAALPPKEFNSVMKEVLGKTKRGKTIISEMINEIKREMQEDDYNEAMGDSLFEIDDLF